MVLWVRFEIYDILSQWSHMITLERPMNYKSLVYGLSVKTFLFLPSLPWMVWEPFKLLLLPTTIRATIRALPSAHLCQYWGSHWGAVSTYPGACYTNPGQLPAGVTKYLRGTNIHWSLQRASVRKKTMVSDLKNANNFWGRTDWSILLHLWEKLHHNIIDKLSDPPQIWPQILGNIWQVICVKDHLLGKIWDQNQITNHILGHFSTWNQILVNLIWAISY